MKEYTNEIIVGAQVTIVDVKVDRRLSSIFEQRGIVVGSTGTVLNTVKKNVLVKFDKNEKEASPFAQVVPMRCLKVK